MAGRGRSRRAVAGETLTTGERLQIERQARIGGGISRSQSELLLAHIDRLASLLEAVIADGSEWDAEQWTVFTDAAIPLVDGWTIRTSKKLGWVRLRA